MEAAPTPYDIIPPPGIAYVPTLWVWLITIFIALVVLLLIWIIHRSAQTKSKLELDPLNEVNKQIKLLMSKQELEKMDLNRIVLASKRALSVKAGLDLSSLTNYDLNNLENRLSETVKHSLKLVLELENLTFQPSVNQLPARNLCEKLAASLLLGNSMLKN